MREPVPSHAPFQPQPWKGRAYMAAATLCFSTAGVVIRLVEATPWVIVFWRGAALAALMLGVLSAGGAARFAARLRDAGWAGVVSGLLVGCTFILFPLAVAETSVANVLILMSTAPFLAAPMARLALGEMVSPLTWAAMGVALAAIALMVVDGIEAGGLLGNLMGFGIAVAYAANTVLIRARPGRDMRAGLLVGGVFSAAVGLPFSDPLSVSLGDGLLIAYLGIGQIGAGLLLYLRAIPHLTAATVALIGLLEMVLAPLWVWLTVNEEPTLLAMIGGGVLLAVLLVHTVAGAQAERAQAEPTQPEPTQPGRTRA